MITLTHVAGLVTVQDTGRAHWRHAGVSPGGALDVRALIVANAIVGNDRNAAGLEGCLSAMTVRFDTATTIALTGAECVATLDDAPVPSYTRLTTQAGSELRIVQLVHGAVWYLAVRGGIDAPVILGSRATLVSASVAGAPLKAGAIFALGEPTLALPRSNVPAALRTPLEPVPIDWLPGTANDVLTQSAWHQFFVREWTVSRTSSRTGYRLEGDALPVAAPADRASEPTCAGAMQLPPDGRPIVLMAEHPTIGGYPVIGVVPITSLGALAQRTPGASVRFASVKIDEVRESRRAWEHRLVGFVRSV
jgi:biotin-dependent carboxylase-like uncharacterized protein